MSSVTDNDTYKLLSVSSAAVLSERINRLLQDGWQLHGAPMQTRQESWGHFKKQGEYTLYSQAMIKKPTPEDSVEVGCQ
jgi:hypothetical protein